MDERGPRYSFDPLEKRGVLLGLHTGQIVVAGGGLGTAWITARSLSGSAGIAVAVAVALGAAVGTVWTKDGHTAPEWAAICSRWLITRINGPILSTRPEQGLRARRHRGGNRQVNRLGPRSGRNRTSCSRGLSIHELPPEPGADSLGVVIDEAARHWAALLPVTGGSFALLDPSDQARRLELWRVTLNSIARPGTSVRRIQWVETSVAGRAHRVVLVVTVAGPGDPGGFAARKSVETIRREARLIVGQLRNSDLHCEGPLGASGIANIVEAAHAKDPTPSGLASVHGCWPMAEEDQWSVCRVGGTWHATYWIAEWPRIDVGPDFLSPLIMSGNRRTVSVIMAPVPPERAAREARSARTAEVADERLRSKAGFLPSARRNREADGTARREIELADGHSEYRFSGYVTVTAQSRSELEEACAENEHAALSSHLEIRRLYGRQREAFTWTLPLGRGLRGAV